MAVWYVYNSDKNGIFAKLFRSIVIDQIDSRFIVNINGKLKKGPKEQEHIAKRLLRKIYDKDNTYVALSNNLEESSIKDILIKNNCKILDGRWIFKFMVPEIIEYISNASNTKEDELSVAIITDDNSETCLKMILEVARKVKMLSIVTTDIDRFKALENYLVENYGIIIRTTNNKKKALLKTNIIFNTTLSEENFNKYTLPTKAVIVNTKNKIQVKSKRFEGINCNYYDIKLPKEYRKWFEDNLLIGKFNNCILLESLFYSKNSYEDIASNLKRASIMDLIGNNGVIQKREFLNFID